MTTSAPATAPPADLSKLTVPQLKALCKERGISGYSKLSKPALLQKLADRGTGTPLARVVPVNSAGTICSQSADTSSSGTSKKNPPTAPHRKPQKTEKRPAQKKQKSMGLPSQIINPPITISPISVPETGRVTSNMIPPATPTSKSQPFVLSSTRVSLPLPISPVALINPASAALISPNTPRITPPQKSQMPNGAPKSTNQANPKRFKPLHVKNDAHTLLQTPLPPTGILARPKSPAQKSCLEYQKLNPESVVLTIITLPPKLAQRKHVHKWSIILSGISDAERRQCVFVSRMVRYAVYLSAIRQLEQKFYGRRLARMLLNHSQHTTNMWPYLRGRTSEIELCMGAFARSFLAVFLKGSFPVSEHLCTNPDNEKQMVISRDRFILTRLWFLLSTGDTGNTALAFSSDVVVDAQEVVKGEIWTVTVQKMPKIQLQTFYVLEQTCEVIGHSSTSTQNLDVHSSHTTPKPVRADWWEYINFRQISASAHDSPPAPLLAHLKWQNHEEYMHGISKLWLKRIESEGDWGAVKRVVAERYIMACVVGNSVSGSWMSSAQMEQDYAGNSPVVNSRKSVPHVNMFLPAHHHVESLHFTTADGTALHHALAVVQTPGREYYIFRDNGMQVGCEEDGVGDVWRSLLRCSPCGKPI
ncbi:hypothetical protein FIBSPDRAFT_776099, partial [Athelia psychrophila]